MVEISERRDDMGPCMDPLCRFKAWFIALVPIGLVPDGLRVEAGFAGASSTVISRARCFVGASSARPASKEDSQCG
jgi:hypothetical protein